MTVEEKLKYILVNLCLLLFLGAGVTQSVGQDSLLSVKEIMNSIITPATSTIWRAYELQTDAAWQEVKNAAFSVMAAGELLQRGGRDAKDSKGAAEPGWINFRQQVIDAARQVIVAVEEKDEEALSAAGNDALYPPCESCHQQYQTP